MAKISGLQMTLSSGTKLGRYEIRSKLGEGGMGEVYLAEDTQLGRRVAIKLLTPATSADDQARKRLVREARAAASLDHPNICSVYEVGEAEGRAFIAMQYIKGETLAAKILCRPLDLKESLNVASQIAEALAEAHSNGIVHRDIKPGNIMITSRGQAKVMDFGVAKVIPTSEAAEDEIETEALLSTPGAIIGTVQYMSPEQVTGKTLDGRSDIFSCGVLLFEMLSGQKPFAAESSAATASAILTREPPPLARYSREIPSELERIVSKALRKDPDERYQTAKDLQIDLRQLQKQSEISAELERITGKHATDEAKTETSIVVLPFANMSSDKENEYFCDGLAEELLNALAKIENLRVVARTSAFSFKGKDATVSSIGRALKVSSVLEGSVRKSGNRVRITVQLINAADGYHLWSERYDREMQDIFDVQDEITLAVVDALKVTLLGGEKAAVLKRYTENTEAYELYLKGRYHFHKHSAESWRQAIAFFEKAIEKEPQYAPAFASISSVLAFCWMFRVLPAAETVPKWKAATVRALEIDDNLDEAHTAFGQLRFYYEWNWRGAEKEYLRAIKINPRNAEVRHQYGLFLVCLERFAEAIEEGFRALELDPLSMLVNLQVGWIYLHAGRLDEVIKLDRKMLEIEPQFHGGYWQMGIAYVAKGMYEEALEAYRRALQLGAYQHVISSLGAVCAEMGKRDEALEMLNQLFEMRDRQPVSSFNVARIYSRMGDIERAIEWLEKAYEERNGEMVFLNVETKTGTGNIFGNSIRADPRFQDILRRVGLKPDEDYRDS